MEALANALRRLVELLVAYLAGRQVQAAETRAQSAETDLAAYRRRQQVDEESAGMSYDALIDELRDPPK